MSFARRIEKNLKLEKRDATQGNKDLHSESSTFSNIPSNVKQQRQKEAMQKLASTFMKKTSEKKQPDSWQTLIKNLLNLQRGKLPLLLAVEAGNQSMVRELLSAQTAEQLKVSKFISNFRIFSELSSLCKRYLLRCVIELNGFP